MYIIKLHFRRKIIDKLIKKLFPISWKYQKNGKELAIGIIIYIVAFIIGGLLLGIAGLFTGIPVLGVILGWVLRIVGALLDLYVVVGIIFSILIYVGVVNE